jgi:organic hydroperoxide reductase OsmC/OhrA
MPSKSHSYKVTVTWTGNRGKGTLDYASYDRDHEIISGEKPIIHGSSDPAFRGNPRRYNPEDLLVSALSSCHMLWYLHLCSDEKIVVVSYVDCAEGTMTEAKDTGGHFSEVVLRPIVTITDSSKISVAKALHTRAHHLCFIANSVNFPTRCEPFVGSILGY